MHSNKNKEKTSYWLTSR